MALSPDNSACLDTTGWVYFRMGLYSQARKYLNQALEFDSQNNVILNHLQEAESRDE